MTDDRTDPFPDEPEPEDLAPAGPDGPAREEGPDNRRGESTGVAWGAILLMLGIAIVVVFTVQNTDPVPVRFMWMDGQFPLAIVILITIGAVALLTSLIGGAYRRRRRRQRQDREELERYRGS
ncbi:MAG TPA: lipopolysaccharide assembly protein LapA domain-containing protein [Acidimicrobiia bacterium]|nr:lipopolysaccharide assembly protein LapA domain-containing protein [Acidimicrobiia bacterium]